MKDESDTEIARRGDTGDSSRVYGFLSPRVLFILHPSSLVYRGVTHPGRTVTVWTVELEEARRPHAPTRTLLILDF